MAYQCLPHDGSYYYACIEDNQLVASSVLAHEKGVAQDREELVAAALQQGKKTTKTEGDTP